MQVRLAVEIGYLELELGMESSMEELLGEYYWMDGQEWLEGECFVKAMAVAGKHVVNYWVYCTATVVVVSAEVLVVVEHSN